VIAELRLKNYLCDSALRQKRLSRNTKFLRKLGADAGYGCNCDAHNGLLFALPFHTKLVNQIFVAIAMQIRRTLIDKLECRRMIKPVHCLFHRDILTFGNAVDNPGVFHLKQNLF
jgi:hypothetical protein